MNLSTIVERAKEKFNWRSKHRMGVNQRGDSHNEEILKMEKGTFLLLGEGTEAVMDVWFCGNTVSISEIEKSMWIRMSNPKQFAIIILNFPQLAIWELIKTRILFVYGLCKVFQRQNALPIHVETTAYVRLLRSITSVTVRLDSWEKTARVSSLKLPWLVFIRMIDNLHMLRELKSSFWVV